jgi:hypothetical protein|nr:MAG TPA: hypothetical protein [Caudoviricetes sp.]
MLRGTVVINVYFQEEFDKIKGFCDKNDIKIYRLDRDSCAVLGKPKKMYKLMKYLVKNGRRVYNVELAD